MIVQSSGRAAKSFFVFIYQPIPRMGFFHLPCIAFKALLCVSSPPATISFKCLSSAFITSSAVFPWNATSHGPPICLQVIVFMFHEPPFRVYPLLGDGRKLIPHDDSADKRHTRPQERCCQHPASGSLNTKCVSGLSGDWPF